MTSANVVLLTGLPRSGTTLMCYLLNKLPNSVALMEPMDVMRFQGSSERDVILAISRFAGAQRRQILTTGTAVSKSDGASVPSNILGDEVVGGARTLRVRARTLVVTNVDNPDFNLYIKHPSFFSAALPFLTNSFDCYASIRNPLSVLRSWQDCPFPVSRGRAPAAEQMSPTLRMRLDAESDTLSRQLILLDFYFDRYFRFIPNRVIRYEDVVSSGGHALEMINRQAHVLDENLVSRNSRGIGGRSSAQLVADRLLTSDNACWNFYTRDDVQNLLDAGGQ